MFALHDSNLTIYHGMFFGLLAMVVVVSALVALVFRNILFGKYALYGFFIWLYLFVDLGYGFQFLYPQHTSLNNYSRVFLMIFLAIVASFFLIDFLNVTKHSPFIRTSYRFGNLLLLSLMAGWILFKSIYNEFAIYFLQLAYVIFTIYFILAFVAAGRNYKQNKINSLLFFLAFGFAILGFTCYLFIELGWLKESQFFLNPVLMGVGIEILVLSIGLLYYMKLIFKEKNKMISNIEILKDNNKTLIESEEQLSKQLLNSNTSRHSIVLKSKAVLKIKDIICIISDGHYVDYYLRSKKSPEIDRDTFKNILDRLPEEYFIQIHRRFIINISAVKRLDSQKINLENGMELNISRSFGKSVKHRLSSS